MEWYGVIVVNVNGVVFSYFLKVVRNGYFLKCVVLIDSDIGKVIEERVEDLKKEYVDG